jgi:hypothetical protein
MHATDKGGTIRVPPFNGTTDFFHLIHTGNVGTGAYDGGLELFKPVFEAALDDHVEDLDLVVWNARRNVLQFERFTDHDMFETNGMLRNRRTN